MYYTPPPPSPILCLLREMPSRWCHWFVCLVLTIEVYAMTHLLRLQLLDDARECVRYDEDHDEESAEQDQHRRHDITHVFARDTPVPRQLRDGLELWRSFWPAGGPRDDGDPIGSRGFAVFEVGSVGERWPPSIAAPVMVLLVPVIVEFHVNELALGRSPGLPSGYWRRLMFWRSWVRISAPYTDGRIKFLAKKL